MDVPAEPERLLITGGTVLAASGWADADVEVTGGRVSRIQGHGALPRTGEPVIDSQGLLVVPGFIDIQINGGFGYDFTTHPEAIWEVGARIAAAGVTAFLPTIVSAHAATYARAIEVVRTGPPAGYRGATALGLHFEGPMLSPRRRGAHLTRHLREPSLDAVDGWSLEAGVRIVTLAPELPGASQVVRTLVDRGVVTSAGHSDASIDEARKAFAHGVRLGTHLFNAMSGFGHRSPGLAGALLAHPTIPAGIIADGIHVHPAALAVAWRAKGPDGLLLVTDAVAVRGAAAGADPMRLGDRTISIESGAPRARDGTLAGSSLAMDAAVRNVVAFTGCTLDEAITAAASTPARVLEEPSRGAIRPGAAADFALLTSDLRVAATIVGGHTVFDDRPREARLRAHDRPGRTVQ